MSRSALTFLKSLVAIPSQNPMGRANPGAGFGEKELTDHLTGLVDQLGLRHFRQEVHPGQDNLFARLDGDRMDDRRAPVILFEAHQDTVPAEGMTIAPWTPNQIGDRLYGRGSCDVKGGMAAMLAVLARLKEERPKGCPTVVLACSVNEEHGFSGAEAMDSLLTGGAPGIVPVKPTAAIVAEPTQLQTIVAHKGVVRWVLHTEGRAAHSATPDQGTNAIYRMGPILDALSRYQHEVLPGLGCHPLCGPASLSVGVIRGGLCVNTVPDHCSIEIDRRLMPEETPEQAQQHLLDYLGATVGAQAFLLDPPVLTAGALSDADNAPLAQRLGASIQAVTGQWQSAGVPYATDAPCFARLGIPTVVFGPGSIEQAHTKDEWISVEQLEQAAEVLYDFVVRSARD